MLERLARSPALSAFNGTLEDRRMRLLQTQKALEQAMSDALSQKADAAAFLAAKLDADRVDMAAQIAVKEAKLQSELV